MNAGHSLAVNAVLEPVESALAKLAATHEQARLDALDHYDIMDTPPEEAFDSITRVARQMLNVPMAAISFIDGHREWFKSREGLCPYQIAREAALSEDILATDGEVVIRDAAEEVRFRGRESVTGAPHIRFYAGTPLRSAGGQIIGALSAMDTGPRDLGPAARGLLADLGKMVVTVLELRLRTTVDRVTGVMSRGAFWAEAERAASLARRHRQDLGCLMVGIDHLQTIVERHGTVCGDEMLSRVANVLRTNLRASDVVGRVGNATFAILLPFAGKTGAREAAERLHAAVGELEILLGGNPVPVSASFGLANFDPDMRNTTLMEKAEAGLFHARKHGGNRIVVWPQKAVPGPQMRRRVFKAGRMESADKGWACTVRTLSGHHAVLEVNDGDALPDRFVLRVPSEGLRTACRMVSRDARQIEVEIV